MTDTEPRREKLSTWTRGDYTFLHASLLARCLGCLYIDLGSCVTLLAYPETKRMKEVKVHGQESEGEELQAKTST